ncbi:MAG TPA: Calx-beta domain-containing protein, partial [Acidimicrobiia bacterium]|nr:Calx-beta domain-containing protein [Acidimicrobiia bacterium]
MTIGGRRVSVVAAVLLLLVPLGAATPVRAATAGSVTIDSVSQPEGDAGSRHLTFTVTRSGGTGAFAVDYATNATNSATDGRDFAGTTGTLFFGTNQNTAGLAVDTVGDFLDEDDETFAVELTNPTNSVSLGGAATGTGTIVDDDAPPSISITGPSIGEGNAGRSPATFVASLSAPSGRAVTVQVATADGSATAPGDYAGTTGTVTFAAGDLSQPVRVAVAGDTVDEADETFSVVLSAPSNATVADPSAIGTILNDDWTAPGTFTDDDDPPSVSIAPAAVTVPEGNRGPSTRTFDVTLSGPSGRTVTVDATTADGTATSGRDYTAVPPTTLTFAPGETVRPVTISTIGDTVDENDETFTVTLSNPSAVTVAEATTTVTIADDDAPPTVSVGDAEIVEGDSNTTPGTMSFTVTLST